MQLRRPVAVLADDARRDLARLDRHRLVDDAALLRVVAHLDVTGDRKVLAERVADEAVVGQEAAQVRVPGEDDAVEIERLALEPVRRRPHVDDAGDHGKRVVGREDAHAQTPVVRERKQVIDGREARPARVRRPHRSSSRRRTRRAASRSETRDGRAATRIVASRSCSPTSAVTSPSATVTSESLSPSAAGSAAASTSIRVAISARSCWSARSCSAAAGCRTASPRRSAGSRERRCRPARCGRSRARPSRNSGSSRRRSRTSPSR